MKNSKKGISLIVLIITIIVIVILATAILVSVINNNPISEANKARYESDRDNMQAVFTNTVGKIMAENQGVVNVTAGQINTETKDVNETTGEVAYTVENAMVAANASGKIYFDKGTNDATTYYTGKKLPIYAAGETKWYVDSEGVLSLEVAGVKYGSGEIESGSGSEEETLVAGLYDENGNMTMRWEELIDGGYLIIDDGVLYGDLCGCLYDCSGHGGGYSLLNLNGKLVIDDSVKSIGNYAFSSNPNSCGYFANFNEIVIPNSVTSIGYCAFDDCANLMSVTIPDSVISVSGCPFANTPWLSLKQEESPLVIAGKVLIDGKTCDGDVIIPDSVISISDDAFNYCKNLTSITIPDSVTSIGNMAFYNCTSLTSITIPDSVTSIGSDAFNACRNMISANILSGIKNIPVGMFQNCSGLKSVNIPNSVTSIGGNAFNYCDSLITVNYTGTQEQWNAISIASNGNSYLTNATINYNYVP